jgi:pyruvate ferredoxin oxidoreductase alpha subunit
MRNTAGVGVTAALLDMDPVHFKDLIREAMSGEVMQANIDILDAAYERGKEVSEGHDLRVPEGSHDSEQAMMTGSNAIAYGAIDAGCRFISGYPMTPWTDVFTIMAQNLPEFGGISEQVEDEIAAAALALGASHAGVKAMSGSSGGGFALMSEPLGLAEMTETPIVLVEAMRAGPSTGLPTKPEQSDLEHVLYTSQGDSNRVVMAPANIRECYEQTRLAFELAYDYQLPAIVLYDQKIQGEVRNVPTSFFDREPDPSMGKMLTEEEIRDAAHHKGGKFQRFAHDPEGGVNPRTVPGQKDGRFLATGNESEPTGHISEDTGNRTAQMDRRIGKLDLIRENLDERESSNQTDHGPSDADLGILTWGSQQDTVFEAVDRLNEAGRSVKALGVSDMLPYPEAEVSAFLESVEECLVVEMNATGQFRGLTQKELGQFGSKLSSLLKYDGEPFEPGEIVEGFESSLDGGEPASQNVKYVPAAGD